MVVRRQRLIAERVDMSWRGIFVLAAVAVVNSVDAYAGTPILTEDQVVQMADKFAIDRGINLSKYKRLVAHYEAVTKNEEWCLLYDSKGLEVGGHFYVFIHDKTRKIRLRGGL